jgi:hypothetical protein
MNIRKKSSQFSIQTLSSQVILALLLWSFRNNNNEHNRCYALAFLSTATSCGSCITSNILSTCKQQDQETFPSQLLMTNNNNNIDFENINEAKAQTNNNLTKKKKSSSSKKRDKNNPQNIKAKSIAKGRDPLISLNINLDYLAKTGAPRRAEELVSRIENLYKEG